MTITWHIPDAKIDELVEGTGSHELLCQACVRCGMDSFFTEIKRYQIPLKWEDDEE